MVEGMDNDNAVVGGKIKGGCLRLWNFVILDGLSRLDTSTAHPWMNFWVDVAEMSPMK